MAITPGNTVALYSLTLTGGNVTGHGGAIYNDQSTLTLTAGNSANFGGAIFNEGATLTLTDCTLSDNSAGHGGGIFNSSFNGSATLTLTSCTLSGNSAGGHGGAIYNNGSDGDATLTLANTIVATNSGGSSPDLGNLDGTVTAEGFNLLSDLSDSSLSPGGAVLVAADPRLAPLGDYGGPTATMPPLPDSPAIGAGGVLDNPLLTDQRGFPRPNGLGPDIGAVEFQGISDLALFWDTDWDGDGRSFGFEFATGTDPFVADTGPTGGLNAPVQLAGGGVSVSFDFNPQAADYVVWILEYSPDLSPGSWIPLYHSTGNFDELDDVAVYSEFIEGAESGTITIDDQRPADRAFYRLGVELADP